MKQNYSSIIVWILLPFLSHQTNAFSTYRGSTHISTHDPRTNVLIRYAAKESITNHTIQPFDMEQELAGFKSDLREQTDSSTITTSTINSKETLQPTLQNILYKLDTIYTQSKPLQHKIQKRVVHFYNQIFSQDFGKRGEEYLILQSLLGVSVLYGKFPRQKIHHRVDRTLPSIQLQRK